MSDDAMVGRPRRAAGGWRGRRAARRDRHRGDRPGARRGRRLQGLPDAQPHRVGRGRRRRRDRRATTPSRSTSTTRSRAATGSATRTRSRRSSTRRRASCCSSSTGAARGAGEPDGHVAVRAFGGMKKMRTWFAADKTGFHMLHALFQTSLKYDAVTRYDEWFVTRLLVDDGRVHGVVAVELRDRPDPGDHRQGRRPGHRRLRQGLPVHHERQHQHRRRHGAGLPRRRAAEGHGVRPVPPDRPAVHRHPDHRGDPRRGRLAAQQGRLPLPAGLRPRARPRRTPALRSMELGPRDRLSQAFVHEVEKGRTHRTRRTGRSSTSTCATSARS